MAKKTININQPQDFINVGSAPNSKDGDSLRAAFARLNDAIDNIDSNFSELYTAVGQPVDGNLKTDIVGSVFADDSTLMVDAVSNRLFASKIYLNGTELSTNKIVSGNKEIVLTGGANPYVTFPTVASGENIIIQGGEIASATGAVAITSSDSVVINTNALITTKSWQFGTDGSLYFPDSTVQTTAFVGTATTAEIARNIESQSDVSIKVNLTDSTQRIWRFGEDGDLNLPPGGDILDSTGASVLGVGTRLGSFTFTNNTASLPLGNTMTLQTYQNGGNRESVLTLNPTADSALDVGGGLRLRTAYGTGFEKSWTFNTNGSLTFPDATIQSTAFTGTGNVEFRNDTINDVNGIAITNASQLTADTARMSIPANGSGNILITNNTKTWTFDNNGNLTIPGSIHSESAINIDINLSDSTLRRWQFGEDGGLTLAGPITNLRTNEQKIALGDLAGETTQGSNAIAIGREAGRTTQGAQAVAIGGLTGLTAQGDSAVAIGVLAGQTSQGMSSVAIGNQAGQTSQGQLAVAIGALAGETSQGLYAVAMGYQAGTLNQSQLGVAIGYQAGYGNQGQDAVAIGRMAAQGYQGNNAVAIGLLAGLSYQGANAIAIGSQAGQVNQPANSIVLNASGNQFDPSTTGFFVNPLRNVNGGSFLNYNTATKEIGYSSDIRSETGFNIDINLSDSTLRRWSFGEDGELTFPDTTVQTTAWTGTLTVNDSGLTINGGTGTIYQGPSGVLQVGDKKGGVYHAASTSSNSLFTFGMNGGGIMSAAVEGSLFVGNNLPSNNGGVTTAFGGWLVVENGGKFGTDVDTLGNMIIGKGVFEKFQAKQDATGTVEHDCLNGHIFYHTSPDANWTANFTNLNIGTGYTTSVSIVIAQGGTGYYPDAVQIGGVAQTIKWQGNATPTPSTNRTDVVTFSILNNSGTYVVLGQLTGF